MAINPLYEIKNTVTELCIEVGDFIKTEWHKVQSDDIEVKDLNSLVSYVDKEAEKLIVKKLASLIPEAGFITEENTVTQEKKAKLWIVDPLDGTTNFLYKIPHFSISIALQIDGEVVFGAVHDIILNTTYTAIKGFGAWENNNSISVRQTKKLSETIAVTGFPYKRDYDIDKNLSVLKHFILHCRGIRRLGSAALDLAYVASGKIDIYYEKTLNIWDIAAGYLLVNEAGGQVSGFNEASPLVSGSVIATNTYLHDEVRNVIHEKAF